ncbi:MAG: acyl-CoA dehydrogenase family protein [Solirubrobacterales bacterium]
MRFDFTEDQHEIKRTAKDFLASRFTPEKQRESAESGEYDAELSQELTELGWPGVAISEQYGGGGLGYVELASLLEESGYALLNGPFLSTVTCAAAITECGSSEQKEKWLGRLASGEATGAFGLTGEIIADAEAADVLVVADRDSGTARLIDDGQFPAVKTIDPSRRYARPEPDPVAGEAMSGDPGPALDLAAVLVSAELVGISQRALDMTLEYVKDRRQFGRPVGSFQAVQHRCAQMLLQTEGARSASYFAAWAADADRQRLPEAASLAKSSASKAGIDVTASAIQAHGGIGFTWEANVHWFYKRAQLDAAFLGGSSFHNQRLTRLVTPPV